MASPLLFVAILLVSSTAANPSPRLIDFQHGSLTNVLEEEPLKGSRGLEPTQLLLKPREGCGPKLYFLVIVHSAPDHFRF